MKSLLATAAVAAILSSAPAFAQPPTVATEGKVRVEGVAPEKVLGAIDTEKLLEDAQPVETADAPAAATSITVETKVEETATARVETLTEVITPVSTRPELDATNPIAPEVQAPVKSKANYTTADIAAAQLAAALATPVSTPTTIVTTTRTTPKEGGCSAFKPFLRTNWLPAAN